jgi:WD40 repeat protein
VDVTTDGFIQADRGLLELSGPGEAYPRREAVAAVPGVGRLAAGYSGPGGSLVQVWDFDFGTALLRANFQPLAAAEAYVLALAAHPGGEISLVDTGGRVQRFGLPEGSVREIALELPFQLDDTLTGAVFSAYGDLVAAGSSQGAVALWSGLSGDGEAPSVQLLQEGSTLGKPVAALAFSPQCGGTSGDCQIAAAFENRRLVLWGEKGSGPTTYETPGQPLGLSFAPDGKTIAVSTDAGVHLLQKGDGVWGAGFPGYAAVFSPAGELAVVGGGPGGRSTIALYDVQTGAVIHTLDASGRSLAFSPDGQLLMVSGVQVEVWQLSANPPVLLDRLPNHAPYGPVVFSPDGMFLIAAGWDGTVRVWGAR